MIKKIAIYTGIALAVVLSIFYFGYRQGRKSIDVEVKKEVDTVYHLKYDTVKMKFVEYKTEKVIDTVYLHSDSAVYVPIPLTQRIYASDSYRLWVSGYNPRLDSIETYNRIEYRTIKDYREIVKKEYNMYLYTSMAIGKQRYGGEIGGLLTTPNGYMFKASGMYVDNNFYGVLGFGLKIF